MSSATAAILGAGTTDTFGDHADRATLELTSEALADAVADAGLTRIDVDGLITNMGTPLGVDYYNLCTALGLNVRFAHQTWAHGRFVGPCLQLAALAVERGLAEYVAVGVGLKFSGANLAGNEDVTLLSAEHAERPWHGMTAPVAGNALATRYYMERYGATSRDLAHVAVAFRRHAALNDRAQFTDPLEVADHQASRWIVEPLRLLDCSPQSDGGAFVVVGPADAAADLPTEPVPILGMEGLHAGRDEYLFAHPGMGIRTQPGRAADATAGADQLYDDAGVDRATVDALYTYDAFTPNVWYTLERWGFCDPGTAHEFTRDGAIELDGTLPMNTNGGLLSEGHISGWNHVVEMYDQLRGRCGDRQLPAPEILQWATPFGDGVVLGGPEHV